MIAAEPILLDAWPGETPRATHWLDLPQIVPPLQPTSAHAQVRRAQTIQAWRLSGCTLVDVQGVARCEHAKPSLAHMIVHNMASARIVLAAGDIAYPVQQRSNMTSGDCSVCYCAT